MSNYYTPGWVDDPVAVAAVAAQQPFPTFGQTDAGRVAMADLPKSVFLWKAELILTGKIKSYSQGQVGSCVSFGTNTAIRRTMAAEIVAGESEEYTDIAEEVTYAGSRVEVGGGRISGDGSIGAWAAEFVRKWGVVARAVHGQYDLTAYSESRCRDWGRRGVPDDLEPLAKKHSVQAITKVTNLDELKQALAQGYGVAVCSDQGFSMRRDENGVAQPSGSWAHCMCFDGYYEDGGKLFVHDENSWGPNAHTGPVGWGDPPPSGFWCEGRVAERMLRQNDSWAFSRFAGFPARKLSWII